MKMENKILIAFLIVELILVGGIVFAQDEENFPDRLPTPEKIVKEELPFFQIFVFVILIFSATLIILLSIYRKKAIFFGGFIGGLYALIPSLITIYNLDSITNSGDPGPYWIFTLLPFLPVYFTLLIFDSLIGMISQQFFKSLFGTVLIITANVIFWIFIGSYISYIIKSEGGGNENI